MNTKTGNRQQPNKMYSNVKGSRVRGWGWGRGQARLSKYSSVCTQRGVQVHTSGYYTEQ